MRLLRNIVIVAVGTLLGRRRSEPTRPTPGYDSVGRRGPRWWLPRIALAGVGLGLAGFLVAASGIIPIKASSGHWAVTQWLLEFSMERSVATHSLGIAVPPLADPALVLKGAGHYESGCMPCHGSPTLSAPRVAWAMTPTPPDLARAVTRWDPEELFYIVKHGIKFTGMPAWPSLKRDDEVWAMVAFLQQLSEMDGAAYRRLVEGEVRSIPTPAGADTVGAPPLMALIEPAEPPPSVTANCGRCHGVDGQGRGVGAFPKLAGQREDYLYAALSAYAEDRRHSGIMKPLAASLTPEAMREVARYYASLPPPAPASTDTTDAAAVARGEALAHQGDAPNRIPACRECHGPVPTRRNTYFPKLAGQYPDYLILQLQLFHDDKRGGSPFAHLMHPTAERLSEAQMRDVAAYYSSLGGE